MSDTTLEQMMSHGGLQCDGVDGSCRDRLLLVREVERLTQRLAAVEEERERLIAEKYPAPPNWYLKELQDQLTAAKADLERLQGALERIRARILEDSPDDVEAEVASGRTLNDVYVIAKAALAPGEET